MSYKAADEVFWLGGKCVPPKGLPGRLQVALSLLRTRKESRVRADGLRSASFAGRQSMLRHRLGARHYVVVRVLAYVVARAAVEPRVEQDLPGGQAAVWVAAQQRQNEVAGPGRDPFGDEVFAAADSGEQSGRVGVVEGVSAGVKTTI